MRSVSSVVFLVLAGCVTENVAVRSGPPREVRLVGLRGKTLQVLAVDRTENSAHLTNAAQQGVENHLRQSGVVVSGDAPTRLVLELERPDPVYDQRTPDCAKVVGHLETTAQAYLPSRHAVSQRCIGADSAGTTGPANELMAALMAATLAIQAVDGSAAAASNDRRLLALSEALGSVLEQLDTSVR